MLTASHELSPMTIKYAVQTLNRAVFSHSMLLVYDLTTVMPEQHLVLCTDVETLCIRHEILFRPAWAREIHVSRVGSTRLKVTYVSYLMYAWGR